MRIIKLIVGVASLLAALLLGSIVAIFFWYSISHHAPTPADIGMAFVAAIITSALVANRLFLIVRRHSPLSKTARILVTFGWIVPVLVALIALPAFVRARTTSATNACVNNLRQIDAAKQQWALENDATTNNPPTWNDIRPYLGRGLEGEVPRCPQGGTYIIGRLDEKPRCSIGEPSHSLP
jgi:hypothetical protein